MNIFITGVAGFIGANITKRILEDNPTDTIIGIDNLNEYYDIKIKIWRLKQFEKNRRFVLLKDQLRIKLLLQEFSRHTIHLLLLTLQLKQV